MLDTNREHLVWPGVPAGGRGVQPLFIKNGSDTETMQLSLAIQDCPQFKVGFGREVGRDGDEVPGLDLMITSICVLNRCGISTQRFTKRFRSKMMYVFIQR